MGDATPLPTLKRRRSSRSRGARAPRFDARPAFSSEAPADAPRLRRFGRMLTHRGERAAREDDHLAAADAFERAAWAYEIAQEPLAAAEATLELGRCLLYLNHAEGLRPLAGRIENLAREGVKSLPGGGLITMRVWAAILRRAEAEPGPFLQLIQSRRRVRRQDAARPANSHPEGGLPVIDGMPPCYLIPPPGLSARRVALDDDWGMSPDGKWFVLVLDGPSPAERIESGRRVIDLGRLLDCPARWEIEKRRVTVKVAADRRGYALIAALREESLRLEGTVS